MTVSIKGVDFTVAYIRCELSCPRVRQCDAKAIFTVGASF